ncbi:MAG TPA: PilN domain-containing protein [Syntrophorhabdus sp.]|nr:PilN domain-containing protein [Pseudomonadota bacterium]NMC95779.1 pilus assembly protein PilM [Syntrophorhabdus sp.]HNS77331.1 PilN domain-containing protein [Syntrophorhabdus sp.]HOH27428.1 PilN domain-containing protein [Syntrophorhabdus sp.]
MMNRFPIEKIQNTIADSKAKIQRLWLPFWGKLTYNLAEGILLPLKALSVSIEKGGIAVVYGSRFISKIRIRGSRYYGAEEGKYLQPERFAKTVSLAIDELKAKKIEITLSIPREWAIIRTVELPSTVKENLVSVISYELDRLTPLSSDDALYDFRVLGEKEEKLTVMIWAARLNLVNPYIDALRKEGVVVKKVTVGLSNLSNLSQYLAKDSPQIFLTYNRYGYQGGLVLNGNVIATSGGFFNGEHRISKTERLVSDVHGLIEKAKEQGVEPKILIYPESREQMTLEDKLEIPAQTIGNREIRERFYNDQVDTPFSATGGLLESLWDKANPLDLLSKGLQVAKKTPIVVPITLIIIIAGLTAIYMMVPLQRAEKTLQEIERQINVRKEEVRKIESLKKEIDTLSDDVETIKRFKDARPTTLFLFRELTNILPKTVWLTRLRITDASVDIEGYANSATEIISKLEASSHFRKVEFASPTIRDTRLNADRFVIKMELEGVLKAESENLNDGKKK